VSEDAFGDELERQGGRATVERFDLAAAEDARYRPTPATARRLLPPDAGGAGRRRGNRGGPAMNGLGLLERLWRQTPAGRAQTHDLAESAAARAEATAEPEPLARVIDRCRDELLDALERAARDGDRVPAWVLDCADATRAYLAAKRLWAPTIPRRSTPPARWPPPTTRPRPPRRREGGRDR
jgi:hypothetical protein